MAIVFAPGARGQALTPAQQAENAALAKKVMAALPERQAAKDHALGLAVYARSCAVCHTVDGPNKVGPTLQGIGRRADAAYILESIVEPSKVLVPGFDAELIETEEDSIVGFVMEHGSKLHVTTAAAEPVFIDKKDVKERRKLSSSLMPPGLEKTMSPAELTDLLAYLLTLNVGGPDAVTVVPGGRQLTLAKGDRIVFVGNTFAERMGPFSHFEAALTTKYPDYNLSFRNMGWSADTLTLQPRPLNFGETTKHLADVKADVVFACFGMSESFDGEAGLAQFEKDLTEYVKKHLAAKYNGKGAPRVVLVSPIAHEKTDGVSADPAAHNKALGAYTAVMRKVAEQQNVPFVDLFTPTRDLMAQPGKQKLTLNGIHLNDYGYWVAARVMMQQLFPADAKPWRMEVGSHAGGGVTIPAADFPAVASLPAGVRPEAAHFDFGPTLAVKGLKPGRYALKAAGETVVVADAAAWERGVGIPDSPIQDQVAKLRENIEQKNQAFFHRYRAVNGEYIYGRRKAPFGIVNFPTEMAQWDELVGKMEQYVWSQAKVPTTQQFELVPADK